MTVRHAEGSEHLVRDFLHRRGQRLRVRGHGEAGHDSCAGSDQRGKPGWHQQQRELAPSGATRLRASARLACRAERRERRVAAADLVRVADRGQGADQVIEGRIKRPLFD